MDKLNHIKNNFHLFFKNNKLGTIGGIIVILFILIAVFAPYLVTYSPNQIDLTSALKSPSKGHIFGTDNNGRDIYTRVVTGSRISLSIAFISVTLGAIIGVTLGLLAGWFKKSEMIIMRLVDVLLSFPGIIVALTIISILGTDVKNMIIAVTFSQIPQFARLTHGQVLSVKEREFVTSSVTVGADDLWIMQKCILPNILSSIIVQMSILIPSAIMMAASLSFLGLGVRPPTAEWGSMLQDSVKWFRMAPHMMIFPGLALMLVVFGFNTLGDGLRVALDPRMKNR